MRRKITVLSPPEMVDDVLFDMTHMVLDSPIYEHSHDCIEITVACSGTAIHTTEKGSEKLQKGDVFLIPPGASHAFSECRAFEHFNISCSPDMLSRIGINLAFIHGINELFQRSTRISSFHLNSTEFNDAKRIIDTMFEAYGRDKKSERGNLRANFAMLLCLFAQAYSLHHESDKIAGRLDKVIAYINEHFKGKITLPEIAKIANLSVSQLVRTFKQNCGTPPGNYILELRLNEGRRLLNNTNLAISEIAYLSGFNDTNYFSRAFRKRFGTAPNQCRKKN